MRDLVNGHSFGTALEVVQRLRPVSSILLKRNLKKKRRSLPDEADDNSQAKNQALEQVIRQSTHKNPAPEDGDEVGYHQDAFSCHLRVCQFHLVVHLIAVHLTAHQGLTVIFQDRCKNIEMPLMDVKISAVLVGRN
jgi:hypothetical protein